VRRAVVMAATRISNPETTAILARIAESSPDDEAWAVRMARDALDERRHATSSTSRREDIMRSDKGYWERRRLFLAALESGDPEALVHARALAGEDPPIAILCLDATWEDALDIDLLLDTFHKTQSGPARDEASRNLRDGAALPLLMILADTPPLALEQLKDVERLANASTGRVRTVARSVLWRSRLYAAPWPAPQL
jgi:hypothetical protein